MSQPSNSTLPSPPRLTRSSLRNAAPTNAPPPAEQSARAAPASKKQKRRQQLLGIAYVEPADGRRAAGDRDKSGTKELGTANSRKEAQGMEDDARACSELGASAPGPAPPAAGKVNKRKYPEPTRREELCLLLPAR